MQPRQLVSLGMKRFAELKIEDSIQLFDRADAAVPNDALTPCYLWQRGISLYCADKFQEGSNQFRYDVKVNPLDRGRNRMGYCLSKSYETTKFGLCD